MTTQPRIRCDSCGFEGARERLVSRSYGQGPALLVVEGVPVVICPRCGEAYMTAHVLHELGRLKANRHTVAAGRVVDVVRFGEASEPS